MEESTGKRGLYRVQERDTECDELSSCRSVNLGTDSRPNCSLWNCRDRDFLVEDAFPGTCVTRELQMAGLWPPKCRLRRANSSTH